jgi:hypothetical protein
MDTRLVSRVRGEGGTERRAGAGVPRSDGGLGEPSVAVRRADLRIQPRILLEISSCQEAAIADGLSVVPWTDPREVREEEEEKKVMLRLWIATKSVRGVHVSSFRPEESQ